MEARFGHDFSRIRVHDDADADAAARALNANAFTAGEHIVFRAQQFEPEREAGRQLLDHELSHVVEQRSGTTTPGTVQCQTASTTPAPDDAETKLGKELWSKFPNGVTVVFYDSIHTSDTQGMAEAWAQRESAIGPKGQGISAATLAFGRAIDDARGFQPTITAMSSVLASAATRTAPSATPAATTAVNGPAKIRNLALFSHGWSEGVHLAGDITTKNVAATIKSIAPALNEDVNVILYACSAGRAPTEAESWTAGTMTGGGAGSLASAMRDALLKEGRTGGTVWGHTTIGSAATNFALREFSAASGEGAAGESYVSKSIFTAEKRAEALSDLRQLILDQGYEITDDAKFTKAADTRLTSDFYKFYANHADKEISYGGAKIGEAAPMHPQEVATAVLDSWTKTYWPSIQSDAATSLIKTLRLKKAEATTK